MGLRTKGTLAGMSALTVFMLLWTGLRLHWFGENPLVQSILTTVTVIIGFPLRLYVAFVMGETSSWSFPVLFLLLLLTGLFWGFALAMLSAAMGRRRA